MSNCLPSRKLNILAGKSSNVFHICLELIFGTASLHPATFMLAVDTQKMDEYLLLEKYLFLYLHWKDTIQEKSFPRNLSHCSRGKEKEERLGCLNFLSRTPCHREERLCFFSLRLQMLRCIKDQRLYWLWYSNHNLLFQIWYLLNEYKLSE